MRKNIFIVVTSRLAVVGTILLLSSFLFLNPAVADDANDFDLKLEEEARLCIDDLNTKNLDLCMAKVRKTCVTRYLYFRCNYRIAIRGYDYYLEKINGDKNAIDDFNEIYQIIGARCAELSEAETDRTAKEAVKSQCAYRALILGILANNPFAYVEE